jgi:hypothetical protein
MIETLDSGPRGSGWSSYQRYGSGVEALLGELSPIRALVALERLMLGCDERIAALRALLVAHDIRLDGSDESIRRLNQWFVRNLEGNRQQRRLLPVWYSVTNDVALFLGQLLIGRTRTLRWLFQIDNGSLQYPARGLTDRGARTYVHPGLIIAFPVGSDRHYRLHLDEMVASYGHAVLAGHHVDPDYFLNLLLAGVLAV